MLRLLTLAFTLCVGVLLLSFTKASSSLAYTDPCSQTIGCWTTFEDDINEDCTDYVDITIIAQSNADCACQEDPNAPAGSDEICLLEPITKCTFNITISVHVPSGKSAKGLWGSECKGEGDYDAPQIWGGGGLKPRGCNAVKMGTVKIYSTDDCSGDTVCEQDFTFECSNPSCNGTCPE